MLRVWILNIATIQKAVREYENMNQAAEGTALPIATLMTASYFAGQPA
jgi:hypothetical protein